MFKTLAAFFGRPASIKNNTAALSNENAMRELLQMDGGVPYPVTDQSAVRVSTVYACLAKLGGAVLQLPLHQYQINASGDRERTPTGPLWWLLNESPSDDWTAASWKEWIIHCVALRGDQHTEIVRGPAGQVRGLMPLHPDNVAARKVEGQLLYRVVDPYSREVRTVAREDMLHFCGYGFNGHCSLSVIQWAARQAVSNSLAAGDFTGRTLSEGAMPQIALTYPNKLSSEQAQLLRDSFVSTYGDNSGRAARKLPLVLSEGATVKELSISPVDMQLLEARRFEREDICQAFGVPPVLIGDTEKASSWGTGIEQITLGFVLFTLKPHLARWEEELNRKLFKRAGQFVEFELDGLLRGDSKAQADAFRVALGGPGTGDGFMTVNEVRRLKNLPPMAGAENDSLFKAQRGKPPAAP